MYVYVCVHIQYFDFCSNFLFVAFCFLLGGATFAGIFHIFCSLVLQFQISEEMLANGSGQVLFMRLAEIPVDFIYKHLLSMRLTLIA